MDLVPFRKWIAVALLAPALVLPAGTGSAAAERVRLIDNFEHGLAAGWKEKSFQGHTAYRVVADGDGHVLQAISQGTASGLVYKIDFSPEKYPILAWRWKVKNVLAKGNARTRAGDDFAARLYVVFPSWFFPLTKSLSPTSGPTSCRRARWSPTPLPAATG
jgi:hypothetical protein